MQKLRGYSSIFYKHFISIVLCAQPNNSGVSPWNAFIRSSMEVTKYVQICMFINTWINAELLPTLYLGSWMDRSVEGCPFGKEKPSKAQNITICIFRASYQYSVSTFLTLLLVWGKVNYEKLMQKYLHLKQLKALINESIAVIECWS